MIAQIDDWFGKDFRITNIENGKVTIRLRCNEKAIRFWALQYGPYVEIIEPLSLREQLRSDIEEMRKKYTD